MPQTDHGNAFCFVYFCSKWGGDTVGSNGFAAVKWDKRNCTFSQFL